MHPPRSYDAPSLLWEIPRDPENFHRTEKCSRLRHTFVQLTDRTLASTLTFKQPDDKCI